MAKIDRYNGNVQAFASDAVGTERTVFGGTAQSDELSDQLTPDFLRGWGVVGASEFPTMQDFSALGFTVSQFLSYFHQMGVAEWNSSQEYPTEGSLCIYNGNLWKRSSTWLLGDEPSISGSWDNISESEDIKFLVSFYYTVANFAFGDDSVVTAIDAGVDSSLYDYFIDRDTGQIFHGETTGVFSGDFDPATGVDSGLSGPIKNTFEYTREAPSRSASVVYTNTKKTPIRIEIRVLHSSGVIRSVLFIDSEISNSVSGVGLSGSDSLTMSSTILPSETYSVTLTTGSITKWTEISKNV